MNYVLITGTIKKVDKTKSYCNGIYKLRFYVDNESADALIPVIYESSNYERVEELEKELKKGLVVGINGSLRNVNNRLVIELTKMALAGNTCN